MPIARVLIVGGGIAGLVTAAGLRREGFSCEIVERAAHWAPIGAGIVLGVNAMSVMRSLGIAEEIARRGTELGRGAITDEQGRELSVTDFSLLRSEFGPTIALHRAELHETLLDAARDVPISMATSVDAIHQSNDGVDVRISDGRQERFDLVIGSDGVGSRVRELLFGDVSPTYSGYTCWRMIVPSPLDRVELREMWGRGQRFGIAPIGGDRLYCFAVANAPRGEADPIEGRLARFRTRFAKFGGQVPEILATLDHPKQLIHNDLEEVPERRWHEGRVLLIGDAAHAMTPNMGQGAAMALEDSVVLVELLARRGDPKDALEAWVARREPRVRWVQDQSRRIGRVGQLEGTLACRARNLLLRLTPNRASANALRKIASRPL